MDEIRVVFRGLNQAMVRDFSFVVCEIIDLKIMNRRTCFVVFFHSGMDNRLVCVVVVISKEKG